MTLRKILQFILGLIIASLVVAETIVASIGLYLAPSDMLTPSDAIVVISGGGDERIHRGIELYKAGFAPTLIVAGAAHEGTYSNAQQMKRQALAAEIPTEAIVTEDNSINTYENARGVRAIFIEKNFQSMILVTSEYHQRRALRTFRQVFGDEVTIRSAPALVDFWHPAWWWSHPKARHLTTAECAKILWSMVTGEYA